MDNAHKSDLHFDAVYLHRLRTLPQYLVGCSFVPGTLLRALAQKQAWCDRDNLARIQVDTVDLGSVGVTDPNQRLGP
jgi:hypothetical protein